MTCTSKRCAHHLVSCTDMYNPGLLDWLPQLQGSVRKRLTQELTVITWTGLQVTLLACGMLLTGLLVAWVCKRARPVYLVAYHVFKPPDWCAHVPTSVSRASACRYWCFIGR